VQDSGGAAISGWTDLIPNAQGIIDLHSLTIGQTGLRPTYEVYYQDASDPTGTTGTFTYSAVAPQLCTTVKTVADSCPTGIGVGTADFPAAESNLVGSSTVRITTGSSNPVTTQSSDTASRVLSAPDCLTGITGNVISQGSNPGPVEGITVRLYDSQGHELASAVTDSNGSYHFDNVYPNSYVAQANAVSTVQTAIPFVHAGSTAMPDIILTDDDPSIATLNSRQVEHTSVTVLVHEGLPLSQIGVSGHCTTTGVKVTFTTPGTCTITVTQNSVVKQIIHVTVIPGLRLSRPPASVKPNHGWNVVTRQSLPEAVVTATGPCAVTGTYVYFAYAGTCRITVKQGATTVASYTVKVDKVAPKSGGAVGMSKTSVYFTPDSPVLTPETIKTLTGLLPALRKAHTVLAVGFTTASNAGPGGQASADLSKARAKAVADFLEARGVSVTLQAGLSRLGNPGVGVQSNRRVDLSWR
jgi:outer membrane protein OmpA-like peptidoglycan-associated protein